jgi:hypothetical protein
MRRIFTIAVEYDHKTECGEVYADIAEAAIREKTRCRFMGDLLSNAFFSALSTAAGHARAVEQVRDEIEADAAERRIEAGEMLQ